ncbi:MAG: hypothetical protein WKF61_05080 [Luteimonas sp.]
MSFMLAAMVNSPGAVSDAASASEDGDAASRGGVCGVAIDPHPPQTVASDTMTASLDKRADADMALQTELNPVRQ